MQQFVSSTVAFPNPTEHAIRATDPMIAGVESIADWFAHCATVVLELFAHRGSTEAENVSTYTPQKRLETVTHKQKACPLFAHRRTAGVSFRVVFLASGCVIGTNSFGPFLSP